MQLCSSQIIKKGIQKILGQPPGRLSSPNLAMSVVIKRGREASSEELKDQASSYRDTCLLEFLSHSVKDVGLTSVMASLPTFVSSILEVAGGSLSGY